MARDKGQIYEASDWFKEALQINQVRDIGVILCAVSKFIIFTYVLTLPL